MDGRYALALMSAAALLLGSIQVSAHDDKMPQGDDRRGHRR